MLRGTRENTSLLASLANCAGVMALCFLLLATTVVISPQNLHSPPLQPASAQQAEEREEGSTDSGAEEEEQGSTDSGAEEEEEEQGSTDSGAEEEQGSTDSGARADTVSQPEALTTLQRVVDLAGITDPGGLEQIAGASDSDEVAEIAGASDSEALAETPGITSPEAIDAIAQVENLRGLAALVGLSVDDLLTQVLPEQPPTTDDLAVAITANGTDTDAVNGTAPLLVNLDASVTGGDEESYDYTWDFGDDSPTSSDPSVAHTFETNGTVTLTVTDGNGGEASDTLDVTVYEPSTTPPPTTDDLAVAITANGTDTDAVNGTAPLLVNLDASVTGGDEESYDYTWDFGDDSPTSSDPSVAHTFETNGTVTLTVTDGNGGEASDTLDVTVYEPSTTPPPTTDDLAVAITANGTDTDAVNGTAPLLVNLDASVTGGDEESYDYTWDFGDDSPTSSDPSVAHTFETNGTVTLTVTDGNGGEASDTLDVTVYEPSTTPPPTTDEGTDKWGIKELYPTASNGPTWFIREVKDPTTDPLFYYGIYKGTTIKSIGTGVWQVDARSGTQEHGIRMHVDSPTGKWKNTEMTGYFNIHSGDDQFTMIARHGPSYHDNGGCEAYGYYALTEVDGSVFFKKKLYHFNNGYTKRLASVDALGDIHDDWVGMKFVVYDLPNGTLSLSSG